MTANEKINHAQEELNAIVDHCRYMAQALEELAKSLPEPGAETAGGSAPIHGFITIKRMLRNGLRPVVGQLVTVTLADGTETTWRVIDTEKTPPISNIIRPVVLQLMTILDYRPFSDVDKRHPYGNNRYVISSLADWLDNVLAEKLNVDDFGSLTTRRELGGEDGRRLWLLSAEEAGFAGLEDAYEWYACKDEEERNKRRQLKDSDGDAATWWLRTPTSGSAYNVRHVSTDGSLTSTSAGSAIGVAPACYID